MKLYCVRHGEANSPAVDPERALTKRGRAEVLKVSQHLAQCGIQVAQIMHSGILRAEQTADILADTLGTKQVVACESILNAESSVQPMIEMIKNTTEDTMLVGHLPYMSELVNALVLADENYYPIVSYLSGTVVCLEYYENQRWVIDWLLRPDVIPG